jgi:alanine racemase
MTKPEQYRATVAEIDLKAVAYNLQQLRKFVGPDKTLMPIIKANAYGHGDVEIAKVLEKQKVSHIGVAYLEEGVRLRQKGIKIDIVVLTGGQDRTHFSECYRYKLTPVVYELDALVAYDVFFRKKKRKGKVHLKFDTGMNRLGFSKGITPALFNRIKKLKNITFEGMMTHLANAERPSHHNQNQIQHFHEIRRDCPVQFTYYHLSNSGSLLNRFKVEENMARPGLTLYGAYPIASLRKKLLLKPVMSLKSQVIQLKKVKRGDYISYGYTHRFQDETTVATIPLGYADGFSRFFSNKGEVLIRGKRAPVCGIVCMDVFMVDVGHIRGVSLGDEVVLLGRQKKEQITVEALAERIGSIPWEILCVVSDRVPRRYQK